MEREEGFDGLDEIDEKQQNNKEDDDNNRENGELNPGFVKNIIHSYFGIISVKVIYKRIL